MTKAAGHYSGWVKRDAVKSGFSGPIGVTTTPEGRRIVKFAKPSRIDARKLEAAFDKLATKRRGAGA